MPPPAALALSMARWIAGASSAIPSPTAHEGTNAGHAATGAGCCCGPSPGQEVGLGRRVRRGCLAASVAARSRSLCGHRRAQQAHPRPLRLWGCHGAARAVPLYSCSDGPRETPRPCCNPGPDHRARLPGSRGGESLGAREV